MTASNVDLDSATVRELLRSWLSAAKAQLATPSKLAPKELNRLGELILSAATWVADEEKRLEGERRRTAILTQASKALGGER